MSISFASQLSRNCMHASIKTYIYIYSVCCMLRWESNPLHKVRVLFGSTSTTVRFGFGLSNSLGSFSSVCFAERIWVLHCVPKKVTTFLMISWSRTVRLERFLAHLLLRVQAIDICFYFPTSPISCSYFTLGNCQDLNISKNSTKSWIFYRKMWFWLKISICQSSMVHEGCWGNCPTTVGNFEASKFCWRVQSRFQAASDRVCHVAVTDLVLNQVDKPKRHQSAH